MEETAPAEAPIELIEGGLVAQLFDLIGKQLDEAVVDQFRLALRMLREVGTVVPWWQYNLSMPEWRGVLLNALLEVAVILAGALFAEWLLRRVLARPRRLIEQRAAARQAAIDRNKEEAARKAALAAQAANLPAEPNAAVDHHWSLLRRLPPALMHWLLEVIPLAAFLGVATVLLDTFGGQATIFYNATMPIIEAYTITRIVLSVVHLLASPLGQGLRLMHISDAAASYLNRWIRRIVVLAMFGTALADISLQMGGRLNTYQALSKLVGMAVHIMLLIMVFRSRKATAAAIRGKVENRAGLFGVRGMIADIWPFIATVGILAMWLLWSMEEGSSFQRMPYVFAWSAVAIVGVSLVSILVLGAIDRAFIADRENALEQAGQPRPLPPKGGAKSVYHILAHHAASFLIGIVAFIVLLQVRGVDALSWFESGSVGRRLASALATIAVTCALAVVAWEVLNAAIRRRLNRWTEGGYASRAARLSTLIPLLRATLLFVIAVIVLLAALHQLGISITPLLAGAGIIGIALGFGSQKLVQDLITGLFLLMENAIQVGDFITVANLSGSVEHLSIRTVWLRAPDGALHIVPFSSVSTVTNVNRGIGNASIKVSVRADSDVDKVFAAIRSVGQDMRDDSQLADLILDDPDIWGVDQVDGSMITILGQIRTLDTGRWPVQRGFNRRILQRFREWGIQFVNPQETKLVPQEPFPTMPPPPASS
ncbi:Small-conductance mechanosensitive channel [Nitrosospira sp. Nl5]|uniref:mechanosensitive ion channel domain-containing protein n=1 Tax=Nitrosospira sp. Nl5 TaxID=200120 RepID=UPI000890672E|nr:mechanosensitive ion channel domain-containing protein [Nitrosospira sp. Nl5]SCY28850.1 Small-conductance mechanosensitive channel [Nitrosospira sp. Nl5]